MKIHSREEFDSPQAKLSIAESPALPGDFFLKWYSDMEASAPHEANIIFLSTLHCGVYPSTRAVLLREYSGDRYTFYTHYTSEKGQDIEAHGFVTLTFYWRVRQQQIRIAGHCEKVSPAQSDAYFKSRPLGSQAASAISRQSEELVDEAAFASEVDALERTHAGANADSLKRPPHWGGYTVIAHRYEFWQGRPSRRHERLRYTNTRLPEGMALRSASEEALTDATSHPHWQKKLLYP